MEASAQRDEEEVAAAVVLANELGRAGEDPQRAPAEGVGEPEQCRKRNEDRGAQPHPVEPTQAQPECEGVQGKCHRQSEVREAEQEREIVDERQREQHGRRHPAVDLERNPEQAGRGQRGSHQYDQLHGRLEPDQRRQRLDEKVDAEIADQGPAEVVIGLQHR